MTLVNIRKNICYFLSILPDFRCYNIFVKIEHTWNQVFVERYRNFFIATLVNLNGTLGGFSKIPIIYSRKLHFN
jgi:hypothetical protein